MRNRFIVSVLLSTSILLSPAFAVRIEEDASADNKLPQKLAFVNIRNETEEGQLRHQQDLEYIKSLRMDKEKGLDLPSIKTEFKKLKSELITSQKQLKSYESEAQNLVNLLEKDSANRQYLKRHIYLNEEIIMLQSHIYEIQGGIVQSEAVVGSVKQEIQQKLSVELFDELLRNRVKTSSIDETGELHQFMSPGTLARLDQALNFLPNEIIQLIILHTGVEGISLFNERCIDYPYLWNTRLVSKKWKKASDEIIRNNKKIVAIPLLPNTFEKYPLQVILSLMNTFSLKDVYLSGWDAPSFEKLPEMFSETNFSSKIRSLSYIQSGSGQLTSRDFLGAKGSFYLRKTFQFLPNLEKLNIEGTLGEEGGTLIASSLYRLPKLKTLRIHASAMGPLAVKKIAKNLKSTPQLEELILWGSNPGDVGALALAEHLKNVPHLTTLNLAATLAAGPYSGSKPIHELGLTKLAKAIKKHPAIQVLRLSNPADGETDALDNLKNSGHNDVSILMSKL